MRRYARYLIRSNFSTALGVRMDIFTQVSARDLILNSAILAVVFRAVWGAYSGIANRILQVFSRRVRTYDIDLGEFPDMNAALAFHCLLIRYGTDSYLGALATE